MEILTGCEVFSVHSVQREMSRAYYYTFLLQIQYFGWMGPMAMAGLILADQSARLAMPIV